MRPGLTAVAAALALCACAGPRSALDPAGPAAETIARIWWLMLGGAALVWALVLGILLYALFRGHNTRALQNPQRLIVAGGLVLPTLALISLLAYGTVNSGRITGLGEQVDTVIEVTGHQWRWEFRYRDGPDGPVVAASTDELAIPLGRMVEFHVASADVVHSFWIPRLGGKIDAIPGRVNRLRLRADHDGRGTPIRGQCAEFCGLAHAHMHFPVHVLDDAGYAGWLRERAVAAAGAEAAP